MSVAAQISSSTTCRSVATRRPVARSSVVVCAVRRQEQKSQQPNRIAQMAAAGLAAVFIAASPALAESSESLKSKICASNPTSKICLRDSVKK